MAKTKKGKVDFLKMAAGEQTTTFVDKMFNGEEGELELRQVRGGDKLKPVQYEAQDIGKAALELKQRIEEGDDGTAEDAMALRERMHAHFVEVLKGCLVLPDEMTLSDEEYSSLAHNFGGTEGNLYLAALACYGLGRREGEIKEVDHTSF